MGDSLKSGDNAAEIQLADAILELVRNTDVGDRRGDTAAIAMFGTYLQAHRRLKTIRDLTVAQAGQEAFILARSLLSMTARAIWVDLPVEKAERERRFERWKRRELQDEISDAEGLIALGVDTADDLDELRDQLAIIRENESLPADRDLLTTELQLSAHYQRLYRPGSGYVHFRLRHAIDEVREAALAGTDLLFERPEPELALEALWLSLLTYAFFLECAEKTVQHGLGPRVLAAFLESPAFNERHGPPA